MNLKTFAQQSRSILLKGVRNKLFFWGFSPKGESIDKPMAVPGGYLFRGEAYDDPAVPARWRSLKNAVKLKGLDAVIEEAAYTWFNRLMAIRILAKNGYDIPQLEYTEGQQNVPSILHRARRGTLPFLNNEEKHRLQNIIADYSKEQQAFGILITGYCHSHQLLQRVFGSLDDFTELLLPDDILSTAGFIHLLNTTDAISDEEYRKVELIGWLYQFYISEKKDEVFKKFKLNKKAEAADIPAATQIFTPNWIVKYMVENTVGKIWLDLHPESPLREKMKYLVVNPQQNPDHQNSAAEITSNTKHQTSNTKHHLSAVAETLNPELPFSPDQSPHPTTHHSPLTTHHSILISEISHLKLLDPASGSGHILVEGFDLLFEMYLEEYYSDAEAVESILKNNLFGLDIDKRAAQLAQFAILLKAAARYPEVLKTDWQPQVYAMPDATDFSTQEMMDFLGSDGAPYLDQLHQALLLLNQGQNLGSTIKFNITTEARQYINDRWQFLQNKQREFHEEIVFQRLKPFIPVLCILTDQYEAVAANPPYMGQKNMNSELKVFLDKYYPDSRFDLMTVFMELGMRMSKVNGVISMINLPSWLFISSFEKLRLSILSQYHVDSCILLGRGIFGSDFGSVMFSISNSKSKLESLFKRLSTSKVKVESHEIKRSNFFSNKIPVYSFHQSRFFKLPSLAFSFWLPEVAIDAYELYPKIVDISRPVQGLATGDNEKFLRVWSEISQKKIGHNINSIDEAHKSSYKFFPYNKGGEYKKWYGNKIFVIAFDYTNYLVLSNQGNKLPSKELYFQQSITWSKVTLGGLALRLFDGGALFDVSGCSIFGEAKTLKTLLGLLNSSLKELFIYALSQSVNYEVGLLKSVPVANVSKNEMVIHYLVEAAIDISRHDWDSRETSWDFEKHPLINGTINIQRTYEIWYNHAKEDFFQLHAKEEELNRIFIDIYGLQDELTPEVALKDITILQGELDFNKLEKMEPKFRKLGKDAVELPIKKDEVMRQLISYAMGVFMGRYRLDKPGLHIAHPAPAPDELLPYLYNNQAVEIDEDAIIPLMGNYASFSDDALLRLKHFLVAVWGSDTLVENINFIQSCLDEDIENYLLKDFWKDHVKRYKKKPIYWLFSSPKGAFQVLVYMHRMNAFTVDKIRGNYLMEHLKFLRNKIQRMESSSGLSAADTRQLEKLQIDLDECERYDLILKTIADKQISFDLDDGVTVNYKLFEGVLAEIK